MASGKPGSSPIKNCEECMSLFKYKPSVEKRGGARFCSLKCQNKWQSEERQGGMHSFWKGDKVGYAALHSWVARKLGRKKECQECGFVSDNNYQFHWANLSHKYKRDLKDWARLCVKCHKNYDLGNIQLTLQGAK